MNIVNRLGAVVINLDEQDLMFDKKHKEFRQLVFISILKAKKDKYISKFRFEGDTKFTKSMQKVMLQMVFTNGYAGIIDINKAIGNKLDDKFQPLVKELPQNYIPVSVAPSHFDYVNRVVLGYGMTTPRHNTGQKTFVVSNEDTAIMKYDEDGYTGWYKWLPFAYMQATAMTVLKKRASTMDRKLVANDANNSYENVDFDGIYDIGETFINMSPAQTGTLTGDNKELEIDLGKMLQGKIKKLDFTAQETISDLLEFIDDNKSHWSYLFGERTNTNKKAERSLSDEFSSEEIHFALMETDQNEQAEVFADDFARVFGTNIKVVNKIDETMEKLQSQQRALSGGGADKENKPKKDGKTDE